MLMDSLKMGLTNGTGWGYTNDMPNTAQLGTVAFLLYIPPPPGTVIIVR